MSKRKKATIESHTTYKISGGVGAPLTEPSKKEPLGTIWWIEDIEGLGISTNFDNYEEPAAIVRAWNKMYCFDSDCNEVEDK